MKNIILLLITFCCLASCKKEDTMNSNELFGEWHWKKSFGGAEGSTFTATPNGTAPTLILFNKNNTFENKSACLLPGPSKANFELSTHSGIEGLSKIMILFSQNNRDTFYLKISGSHLILREKTIHTNQDLIFHEFEK
jgi:hypothetical protein